MAGPPRNVDEQLDASLRRIAGALKQNRSQYAAMVEQIVAATGAEVAERVAARTAEAAARAAERHQRRVEGWRRRDERRRARRERRKAAGEEGGDIPRGIVFAVVAIICVLMAVRQPALFWMVFVALGFGMSAISSFARAGRRGRVERQERESAESESAQAQDDAAAAGRAAAEAGSVAGRPVSADPPAEPNDPKVTRIQALCDKLLAELESGPPIVREVVTQPRATIGGLRQACIETARRERELRGVLAGQDEASLIAERDGLAARVSSERDQIVRDRLGQALVALDQQLAHRAELATAATRLEAENTRILYTLENLHMQLLRARSTDMGAPELGGKLRDGLRELGIQIDAVAEALELASAPAGSGTSAVPDLERLGEPAAGGGTPADIQRAEREAAARRAAAARQAQGH